MPRQHMAIVDGAVDIEKEQTLQSVIATRTILLRADRRVAVRQPELVDGSTLSRYPMNNVTAEFLRIEPLVKFPP